MLLTRANEMSDDLLGLFGRAERAGRAPAQLLQETILDANAFWRSLNDG